MNKKSSSRPLIFTNKDIKVMLEVKSAVPLITGVALASKMPERINKNVTPQTIRNKLKNAGVFNGSIISKPCLSKKYQKRRYEIAESWAYKPPNFFDKVIFSDEVPFHLKNNILQSGCWKKRGDSLNPNYINKTFKYNGGSVMFWGCFSKKGLGNIVIVDGIMDRFKYVEILTNNLFISAE